MTVCASIDPADDAGKSSDRLDFGISWVLAAGSDPESEFS
jgi:hypothetical protein